MSARLAVCAQDWPDFAAMAIYAAAVGAALCYGTLHLFGCLK